MGKGRYLQGTASVCGRLISGAAIALAGCSVDVAAVVPRPAVQTDTPGDVVTIRFRNLAVNEAVNVEFYATDDQLEDLPDDLFVPANRITANIGVAGTGIIEPMDADSIEFPCTATLTLGTTGGSFADNETGEPRGVGTPRWAQQGPLGLCHGVVTFEFSGDGVDFRTALTIGG